MARLILSVLPLAAGAALSPVILVAALAVVSSSRSPARRMAAFTAGAALVLAALSVLALTVLHGTGASDSPPRRWSRTRAGPSAPAAGPHAHVASRARRQVSPRATAKTCLT